MNCLIHLFDRGAPSTTAGIRAGVDALGGSFQSAWTFATSHSAARHDAASVGRVASFDDRCACYVYTGPDVAIP